MEHLVPALTSSIGLYSSRCSHSKKPLSLEIAIVLRSSNLLNGNSTALIIRYSHRICRACGLSRRLYTHMPAIDDDENSKGQRFGYNMNIPRVTQLKKGCTSADNCP